MKNLLAVGLISAILGSIVSLAVVFYFSPEKREATVVLKNESGGTLFEVVVEHERGRIEVGSLVPGQVLAVSLYVPSESSHQVTAKLSSGVELKGSESYLEEGTCVVETIGTTEISAQTHLLKCGI